MFACSVVSRATVGTLIALLALFPRAGAGPPPVRPEERGPYGLPARLQNLTDLQFMTRPSDLSPLQKMEVVLAWLAEERSQPTPTRTGLGGGSIDSDYIQVQLVTCLGVCGDPGALDALLGSGQVEDEQIRDGLRLALALCGDRRQVGPLIRLLQSDTSPHYRALAAGALGMLSAPESVAALERALKDPYYATVYATGFGKTSIYPVRQAAEGSLRTIRDPQAVAEAVKRRDAFPQRLAQARKALAANKTALRRLVLAANGRPGTRKVARGAGSAKAGVRRAK
jgi:HEAT repeat protein